MDEWPIIRQEYPNADNYPLPAFPQPLIPPDGEPDNIPLLYEYDPLWSQVLLAACNQLLQYAAWQGTHDEKILAVNRASLLVWQLQHPIDVGEEEYPTPYWDDETDVDDEATPELQEWYGQVESATAPADEITFIQNAVIWLLSGFVLIAAAPSIVGALPAAIFFRTIAVRFTLAFNRGDVREIFRVIIDAADYTEVDTGDLALGDIIEINIDGLADADHHDIYIIRTTPDE